MGVEVARGDVARVRGPPLSAAGLARYAGGRGLFGPGMIAIRLVEALDLVSLVIAVAAMSSRPTSRR